MTITYDTTAIAEPRACAADFGTAPHRRTDAPQTTINGESAPIAPFVPNTPGDHY